MARISLFLLLLLAACRIHPLEDGTFAFAETGSPLRDDCALAGQGVLGSGRLTTNGHLLGLETAAVTPWPHQRAVMKKVVDAWPQSFLLCDEVGLGKTIEAGVLIRQCAIETNWKGRIVVLAPEALTAQWRHELKQKFGLETALDKTVFVLSFESLELIQHLSRATMLVPTSSVTSSRTTLSPKRFATWRNSIGISPGRGGSRRRSARSRAG